MWLQLSLEGLSHALALACDLEMVAVRSSLLSLLTKVCVCVFGEFCICVLRCHTLCNRVFVNSASSLYVSLFLVFSLALYHLFISLSLHTHRQRKGVKERERDTENKSHHTLPPLLLLQLAGGPLVPQGVAVLSVQTVAAVTKLHHNVLAESWTQVGEREREIEIVFVLLIGEIDHIERKRE